MINYNPRKRKGDLAVVKYAKTALKLFLWMLVGSLIGLGISTAVSELYRFLNERMPSLFPSYSVTSRAEYFDTLYTSLWLISLVITVFITVYLSLRYDNFKFESIITKTDGLYEIRTILPTYVSNFAVSDGISAILCGAAFTIPFYFIPMQFIKSESFAANLTSPYKLMSECFGAPLAPIVMALIIALAYLASIPLALKYYRARWFSAFSEV